VLADTREECDGRAAVACRLTVDDGGDPGVSRAEAEEVVTLLDHLPDLWDFVLGSWELDSATSRFAGEADRDPLIAGLKRLSAKPVVGVGRFTSPDTMVRQVRSGILDMIGAARPSIADPFLPAKIEAGRLQEIRECIGCNMCVSSDLTMSPIRCTQNPSMGEEWRRGWHPERIRPRQSGARVLVVGAGPTGLEAACALGQRGYRVVLAEATRELGGRAGREAGLPGLAAWPAGRRLPAHPAAAPPQRRGVPGERDHCRGCTRPRVQRHPGGDRRPLARRRRRAQAPQRAASGRECRRPDAR
jgi:dimethylamine/trimethylamine dehydrogenase